MALNINGTTGISGVDGSVSAPAVTGTDSNTGITFPAADTIKFATGGVERMSITNSGITGISLDFVKLSNVASTSTVDHITFTSLDTVTYKAFRFIFAGLPGTDGAALMFRFMSGSSIASSSNYSWALNGVSGDSASYQSLSNSQADAKIHGGCGNASIEGWRTVIDIVPQTTNDFEAGNNYACWVGNRVDNSGNYRLEVGSLFYRNDSDTDGFKLAPENGSFNKYSYTLYGVTR